MLLKLRAGEKLYLNGAVIKVERKATIELLNDAAFLLEAHVIQPSEANTPLRQLYFVLQTQLMDRDGAPLARQMFRTMLPATHEAFANSAVTQGLRAAEARPSGWRAGSSGVAGAASCRRMALDDRALGFPVVSDHAAVSLRAGRRLDAAI
jgi:flagellar protein FlbT